MIIINNLMHFWKLRYYGIIAGYRHSNLENKMDMLLKPLALSEEIWSVRRIYVLDNSRMNLREMFMPQKST